MVFNFRTKSRSTGHRLGSGGAAPAYQAALASLALLWAGDAGAQDIPRYAETASRVANAIHAGTDVATLENVPSLSPAEYARLRELAGCNWSLQPGATPHQVELFWRCENSKEPASTLMSFDPEGHMFVFSINPLKEGFAPTRAALNHADLPSATKIAALFGKAVKEGMDPSLGGILPLTPLQRDQLAALRGASFRAIPPPSRRERADMERLSGQRATPDSFKDRSYWIIWENSDPAKIGEPSAEIWFDEKWRPIGVTIRRAVIRKATYISH